MSLALALIVAAAFVPSAFADDRMVAHDTMDRSVQSGWGTATQGGEWHGVDGVASVVDGMGYISSRVPGSTIRMELQGASERDVQGEFRVKVTELPVDGSIYVAQAVRVSDSGSYAARIQVTQDGAAFLSLVRLQDLYTSHTLVEQRLPYDLSAGSHLNIALEVTGVDPVSLKTKAWPMDVPEPDDWFLETNDASQDQVRDAGRLAVTLYTSAGASNTPSVGVTEISLTRVPTTSGEGPAASEPADPVEKAPEPPAAPAEKDPDPPAGSEVESTPKDPEPDATLPSGVRGAPGAKAPGSFSYPIPSSAVYVSPHGSDNASGSVGNPVRTITAALRLVPDGGTIVLREGVYHEEVLIPPQKRVTVQPAATEAVWLDGAKEVTDWQASGNVWVKNDWDVRLDSSPTFKRGAADNTQSGWQFVNPERPMAAHPDQVWIDGNQLREVGSLSQVTADTFYVDDDERRLIIGTNPAGKTVEASVLTQAISIRSSGSEVRGIGVRRYATSVPDMGTVVAAADDVTLTDVTIRDNSTSGFYSWSLRTSLERVSLINNGLLGGGAATADGLKLNHVLSMGNNAEGFNHAPVSGAFKVGRTHGVTVTDSAFISNEGRGPWFDESTTDIVFTGNDVIGNAGHGVLVELSERAVVADNIIAHNDDFGLYVLNSGNVKIWNNTFAANTQRNLNIAQDSRRASDPYAAGHDPRTRYNPPAPWIVRETVISNNVLADPAGNCIVCVQDFSLQYTGSQMVSSSTGNLYHRQSAVGPRWFSAWSRGPVSRDPDVEDSLTEFVDATGQDRRSRLVTGATVVTNTYGLGSSYRADQSSIAVTIPSDIARVSHLATSASTLGAQPR